MAMYRCEARIIGREKRGRSVVAAAAYRSGSKLKDERYEKTHDYSRRSKGIIESTILSPAGSPAWASNPATLWNRVEASEKRADAQLAREFILAVPPELTSEEQFQAAVVWAEQELVTSGMVAEVSLHHTKTGKNPHVHILCTLRRFEGEGFSAHKEREWNHLTLLLDQRETWAKVVNAALEKAGREERVDHRSLKDQGIDRIPEPKIGVAATAMKRRGVEADPERFQAVRHVQVVNEVLPHLRDLQKTGEVKQHGAGSTWWERSLGLLSRLRDTARETVMDTWRSLVESRSSRVPDKTPPPNKGPDLGR